MGMCPSKRNSSYRDYKKVVHKVGLLQRQIKEMMRQREEESSAYQQELMEFSFKEAEWKRERKRMRDEIRRLRRSFKEAGICQETATEEERARRDEAVEKWKTLYLAIKVELDHLIQRTHQGGSFYWKAEEDDFMEDVQRELKGKEETIEVLRAQLVSMEQEQCRRNREVDILRQSLRIMTSKKKAKASKYAP